MFVVTKWSVLALFGGQIPLKHGPCSWILTPIASSFDLDTSQSHGKRKLRCERHFITSGF